MSSCLLCAGTEDGLRTFHFDESNLISVGSGLHKNVVRAITIDPRDHNCIYVGCGLRGWGFTEV